MKNFVDNVEKVDRSFGIWNILEKYRVFKRKVIHKIIHINRLLFEKIYVDNVNNISNHLQQNIKKFIL